MLKNKIIEISKKESDDAQFIEQVRPILETTDYSYTLAVIQNAEASISVTRMLLLLDLCIEIGESKIKRDLLHSKVAKSASTLAEMGYGLVKLNPKK